MPDKPERRPSKGHLEHGYQPVSKVDPPKQPPPNPSKQFGQQPVEYVQPPRAPKGPGGTAGPKKDG